MTDELYEKLVRYYETDDNVTVIIDRRTSARRAREAGIRHRRSSSVSGATGAARACPASSPTRPWATACRPTIDGAASVKVVVHVDGGARGNPGPAAAAAVLSTPDGEVLDEASELIGVATNNVAEYRGVLLGLARARELGATEVELVNDSELVARQLTGAYKVKHPAMRPLHLEALAALRAFERWSIRSVPREQNAARRRAGQRRAGRRGAALAFRRCSAPATASCSACCPRRCWSSPASRPSSSSSRRQRHRPTSLTLNHASGASLTYGAVFLGLCVAGHLVIRRALPHADPYLFPLAAVLASVGIVMVYRINPTLARTRRSGWSLGLVLFAATILWLRRQGLGRARALPLHDRAGGHRHDAPAAPPGDRRAGQRRLPEHPLRLARPSSRPSWPRSRSSSSWPATCATTARCWSPPDGASSGSRFPPMKQFGPLLRGVGRGDGDAAADARDRHLADVLRRLPGPALRGHRALLVPVRRAASCSPLGAWFVANHVGHVHQRGAGLGAPVQLRRSTTSRGQLPARPGAVRAGRRRAAGDRTAPVAARRARPDPRSPGAHLDPARARERPRSTR